MDGGNSLNLLYQDTVCKMGIDPSRVKPTKTTFKGVIPGVEACWKVRDKHAAVGRLSDIA